MKCLWRIGLPISLVVLDRLAHRLRYNGLTFVRVMIRFVSLAWMMHQRDEASIQNIVLGAFDARLDHEEVVYRLGRHHHPHRTGRSDHMPAFSARMTTATYRQLTCSALAGERGDRPPVTSRIGARSQSAI
jgi:hypothetical protein